MALSDARYAELAGAVLNGTPIDWPSVESTADEGDRQMLDQLKVLATVADLHRRLMLPSPEETAGDIRASIGDDAERLEHWAHLRVLERIGRGAFGNVYRAWDTRLDREVALKLVPVSPNDRPRATSIIEEGRLLARVRHPNVVTIYGAEQINDRIGLWMEFVRGRTLQQIADQGKVFAPAEIIDIGIEVCRAIAAVHHAGLVHRDIKAHNVMRADDGRLVLMDFGAGGELTAAAADSPPGTPLYLAPELFAGKKATVQSDIYSLGVLLYHLATKSYPVRANSLHELKGAHERGERVDVRTARPDFPPKFARVIERAIDPKPARRYQTADDLAADLAALKPRPMLVPSMYAVAATAVLAAVLWLAWPSAPVSPTERPVIAVLPLKNLSAEPDSDYFVDGLTDEIIRNLAVIDGLEVRSRTSSFAFKDKPRNVRDVGEQLGANLVVEGSVLRAGTKLRINAQLIQVAGDVPLWAERFDRELKDVFAIQDEISRAIVDKLRLSLGRGQRRYDTNLEAYELYLKARAVLDRRDVGNAKEAVAVFQQVIAKDPSYAPAYAGIAHAYAYWSQNYFGISFDEGLSLMRPAAQKALELDPLLAEAHAAMGHLYSRERNWDKAVAEFRRALELNPSLTHTHTNYSISTLIPLGRFDEAARLLQAARRADPLSLDLLRETALLQIIVGRYSEAIENLERVRAVDPEFPFASLHLVRALTFGGRPADALVVLEPGFRDNPGAKYWLAHAYVRTGRRAEVEKWPDAHDDRYPYRQLMIHTALGDKDRAFDALERAAVTEPHRVGLVLAFPETAVLRGDPRFAAVRRKLGVPDR
jgi:serine/threonine protein kinase/tetratricopeptide (TPR) repeat protein